MLVKTLDHNEQPGQPILGMESGDRRCRPRVRLALPVVLFRSDAERIETRTEDVSCDSFYCISDHTFTLGDRLECELLIPGDELSSVPADDLLLRCRVRIVRVVAQGFQRGFGVACRLEDYSIGRHARN